MTPQPDGVRFSLTALQPVLGVKNKGTNKSSCLADVTLHSPQAQLRASVFLALEEQESQQVICCVSLDVVWNVAMYKVTGVFELMI